MGNTVIILIILAIGLIIFGIYRYISSRKSMYHKIRSEVLAVIKKQETRERERLWKRGLTDVGPVTNKVIEDCKRIYDEELQTYEDLRLASRLGIFGIKEECQRIHYAIQFSIRKADSERGD